MSDSIPWRVLRYLYAAYYLLVGVYLALSLAGVIPSPHPKVSGASAAFQGALGKTGFMFPLLAFTYITAACALFLHRTSPWAWCSLRRLRSLSSSPTHFSTPLGFLAQSMRWFWLRWLGTSGARIGPCFPIQPGCKPRTGPNYSFRRTLIRYAASRR